MLSAEKLEALERSLEVLDEVYPEPPTYEEFVEAWPSWDTASKRLITSSAAADLDDRHVQIVRSYLKRMGEISE